MLLRIEDIDTARARDVFVQGIQDDLHWLGIPFEMPVMRQYERFGFYAEALDKLSAQGLAYPCFCTRQSLLMRASGHLRDHPRDPDGMPRYDGFCRHLPGATVARRMAVGEPHALRLKMDKALAHINTTMKHAPLSWAEGPPGTTPRLVPADAAAWGDAVIRRKEFPASYHIAVVVDDAAQGVTHVVRGLDLLRATAIHRVLQMLLGLPGPQYHHHPLVWGDDGEKLSKSRNAPSLSDLRAAGVDASEVRRRAVLPDT